MSKYLDTDQEAFDRIKKGLKYWAQSTSMAAELIVEAKERQIWKLKHDSWRDFCEIECGITASWANQVLEARKVTKEIASFVDVSTTKSGKQTTSVLSLESKKANDFEKTSKKANEINDLTIRQVGALRGLSTPEKVTVLEAAKATGSVAPKAIHAAVEKLKEAKAAAIPKDATKPPVILDNEGHEIPAKILALWRQAEVEAKDGLALVSKARSALRAAQESENPCYREVVFSSTLSHLDNAYGDLKRVMPHSVCATCQGLRPDKCVACKGRGFVSKFFWEMCVPEEIRKLGTKK